MTLTVLGRAFIDLAVVLFCLGLAAQLIFLRAPEPVSRRFSALARLSALGGLVALAGAVGVMEFALVTHNFSLLYVAQNNARFTPLLYSITGLWSALEGSLLLWALLEALVLVAVIVRFRRESADRVVAVAAAVMLLVNAFFAALLAGPADPFVHNPAAHPTGAGPNALLQDNPLVAIHPPLLYLGFVGFTVPFAFAVAMLVTGRVQDRWTVQMRRWTVAAWGSLSVGIILGAWWSYQVLGWGGFWGWDPVENAALMPWLTATAFVHSVIVQERRGLFRVWNLSLAVATFSLTLLGTFFTRSGVLESVHSFSASTLGPVLLGAFIAAAVVPLVLLIWRGDQLRSSVGVSSAMSREGLFVANNLLFVGFCVVVLLGTVFPLLYEAVNGGTVTVGAPYFASVAVPASVLLLVLMAVAPAAGWRRADPGVLWTRLRPVAYAALVLAVVLELSGVRRPVVVGACFLAALAAGSAVRSLLGGLLAARRRGEPVWRAAIGPSAGGMVVHLGVVLLCVGIVVSTSYVTRREVALAPGQSTVVAGQTITFTSLRQFHDPIKYGVELVVTVDHHDVLYPAVTTFRGRSGQVVGTPAIDSNLARDIYLTFDALGGGATSGAAVDDGLPTGSAVIGVTVEPLLAWLWIGGLLLGLGSALSFASRRRGRGPAAP